MGDEYWATFSIYDHRSELYKQALLLFDRIVVPIPTRVVGDLSQEEIDHLAAEVEFLERHGAARSFEWDPAEFSMWREEAFAGQQEALARRLDGRPAPSDPSSAPRDYRKKAVIGAPGRCVRDAGAPVRFQRSL